MTLGRLVVTLGLDINEFDRGLQSARSRLRDVGAGFTRAGTMMTAGITAPLAALATFSLRATANFQTGMLKVQAITGATTQQFDELRQMALDLGISTQYTAGQAADAMSFLAMAGFDVNEILGAMPSTLNLAAAGQLDLARAADIVTNILTGYRKTVDELPNAVDVLTKAFTSANVTVEMLGESFKYAGPIARSAGLEFEETAALIALMGNAGIQGSMAGTSLRGAITRLLNPVGQARQVMKELNIQVLDNGGNMRSLIDIFRELEAAGISTADVMGLFGLRAGPASAALLGMGNQALTDMVETLHDVGGTAQTVADVQMSGLLGMWRAVKSAAEGVAIAFTEMGATDWITEWGNALAGALRKLAAASDETKIFILTVAGIAAALGPVALAIGLTIKAVATLNVAWAAVKLGILGVLTSFKLAIADFALGTTVIHGLRLALNTLFLTSPALMFTLVAGAIYAVYKAGKAVIDNWSIIRYEAGRLKDRVVGIWPKIEETLRKLFPTFDLLLSTIERVSGAFKRMYDRVVGHSYVPDMVAGIRSEFATLRSVMTAVSDDEVQRTVAAFGRLGGAMSMIEALGQRYEATVMSIRDLRMHLQFEKDAEVLERYRLNLKQLEREASTLATTLARLRPLQDMENTLNIKPSISEGRIKTGRDLLGKETVSALDHGLKSMTSTVNRVTLAANAEATARYRARFQLDAWTLRWWAVLDDVGRAKEELVYGLDYLARSMGPSAFAFEFMQGVIDGLGPALEMLIEPVSLIGQLLGQVLAPFIEFTAQQLRYLATIASYVVTAIGWLIRAIGKAVNWLLPGNPANGLVKFGQNMMNQAAATRQAINSTKALTETTDRATESMRNVPQGYKLLQLRQYQAAQPRRAAPVAAASAAGGSSTSYHLQPGSIVVQGTNRPVRQLVDDIEAEMERRRRATEGA